MRVTTLTLTPLQLQVGDVILGQAVDGSTVRNTVTGLPRKLGGSGLVAFALTREGREPWDGRLRADCELEVERTHEAGLVCWHPKSCARCARQDHGCGEHVVGAEGHQFCEGRISPDQQARDLARATGSTGATVIHERREADGSLTTLGSGSWERPLCEWYALCTNTAVGTVVHPVLGAVPCCQRCADKHELSVEPY